MTLPKCPCGHPAKRRALTLSATMERIRTSCSNCSLSTTWYDSPAEADRAWCRMVAAEALEMALEPLDRLPAGGRFARRSSDIDVTLTVAEVLAIKSALKAARGEEPA